MFPQRGGLQLALSGTAQLAVDNGGDRGPALPAQAQLSHMHYVAA